MSSAPGQPGASASPTTTGLPSAPGLGLVFASAGATAYGISIVFARMAADSGLSGVSVALYRVIAMFLVAALIAALWRRLPRIAPGEGRAMIALALGGAGVGIGYMSAVTFIPVSVAVVIFFTFPIVIVLLSPLVDGGRLRPALLVLAGVAFTGVALVIGPGLGALDWRGVALAGLASASATLQFFSGARSPKTATLSKIFWVNLAVIPACIIVGSVLGALDPPAALTVAPAAVALLIATYMAGLFFQLVALVRASAVVVGLAFCAEPVVATAASAILLGERLVPLQFLGGALVVGAVATNVLMENRRSRALATRRALTE